MSRYQANIITKNPVTPGGPLNTGSAPGIWSLDEAAYWSKQGLWPNPNIALDAYWSYVSLLLSTTSLGNANNNLFVDSSGAFNPISRNGNTTQGSFSPYSTNWSNYFDGSGDYLTLPSNAALEISSGDFTIEAWVYKASNGNYQSIYSNWNDSNSGGVLFCMNGLTPSFLWRPFNISTAMATGPVVTANTWTHVAVVRSGNVFTVYTNGVAGTPVTYSTNATAAQTYQVGAYAAGASGNFNGYMSNVRVVKGTAVYTSNFTVPTTPLTAISGTSLLTCQSNRFRDASTNNFTITAAGNTSVTNFGPFILAYPGITYNQSDITNWSGYFDGSGDYLTVPNNAALDVAAGDFTMEFWMRKDSAYTSTFKVIATSPTAVASSYEIQSHTDGTFALGINSVGNIVSYALSNFVPSVWYHIVFTRSGNAFRMFVDGVLRSYATNSINFTSGSGLAIGGLSSGRYWDGNISNLRIIKGSIPAAYQTSSTTTGTTIFTPPTSNLTAVSGTSLLTLQNAAFTDNSTNNFVITPNGNVTVTGNSPFNTTGYWSNYLTTNSFITLPNNAALQLGSGDFCVEAWVFMTSLAASSGPILTTCANLVGAGGINFAVKSTGAVEFFDYATTSLIASGGSVSIGQWTHVAATRSGTTLRLFVNGAVVATGTTSSNFTGNASQGGIGSWVNNGQGLFFGGYISNLRVVKGSAVYTSAFTVPTAPLTAISGTTFLACQSSRFADTSSSALTLTPSGSPSVQSFDPFYTSTIASNGGSMYFDGSGDYLDGPALAGLGGSGNFTIQAWIYPTTVAGDCCIYETRGGSGWVWFINSTGYLQVYDSSATLQTASTTQLKANQWTHVALVKNGSTCTYYVNGASAGTFTLATFQSATRVRIGARNDAAATYFGWISGLKTDGSALTISLPSAPQNPSANTTLLVNGMNAGIYDATTINDMETVGNAQVSTVQSKFGGSSVYFDGSGDALAARPNPVFAFGTSSFTIEAWVNVTSYAGTCAILDTRTAGNEATGVIFYINASGQLSIYNNGTLATSSGSISTGTWTHVAVTRNGTTVTFWINGSSSGTATVSTNFTQQNGYVGTAYNASSNPFYGYMDDLRVTNGVARYTSNFTPPTQAFPVY